MTPPLKEWTELRSAIRSMPDKAKELDKKLTQALYHYRINLTSLKVKPSRMDEDIWHEYDDLVSNIKDLIARSSGRLLSKPAKLQQLLNDWNRLLERQQDLLVLIEKAVEAADFYDKMEAAKDQKRRQRASLDKDMKALSKAKLDLIQAIHYIVLREKSGENITSNSVLLALDKAIDFWEESLSEIHDLEVSEETSVERLISTINWTRQQIIKAPDQAEKVLEIERELDELLELDDQIKRATQQSSLYQDELSRLLGDLRQNVSHYWAVADWVSLNEALAEAKEYIQRNINHVRSELYVIRKRAGVSPHPSSNRRTRQSPSAMPIALAKALQRVEPKSAGQVYIDPDADSSVRYLYQDGSG